MEGDIGQLVDDNCSQIEVAFKRMKVGTSRCVGKNINHHIYNHPNHYPHQAQQLKPQESFDKESVDRLSFKDKSETISFSSFSSSPLALTDSLASSNITTSSSSSSSSSISSSSAVNPVVVSSNSMGPYRDVTHLEGQTDTFYHDQKNSNQNYNQNNNNHHLNQSNDNTKYEDGPPADPDVSVEELAAYLDVQLYIPRKMSYMAELMYT